MQGCGGRGNGVRVGNPPRLLPQDGAIPASLVPGVGGEVRGRRGRTLSAVTVGRKLFSSPSLHLSPHLFTEDNSIPCPWCGIARVNRCEALSTVSGTE